MKWYFEYWCIGIFQWRLDLLAIDFSMFSTLTLFERKSHTATVSKQNPFTFFEFPAKHALLTLLTKIHMWVRYTL